MVFDLLKIYKKYFDDPYTVNYNPTPDVPPVYGVIPQRNQQAVTFKGEPLFSYMNGRTVFLPVQFWKSNQLFLTINCCTIRVSSKKNIIETSVAERGIILEQFNLGNYVIAIKGVLIAPAGKFPDDKIAKIREIFETTEEIELYNAFTGLFRDKSMRVAVTDIDFPEVEGSDINHRPFTLTCKTDFVEGLIVSEEMFNSVP